MSNIQNKINNLKKQEDSVEKLVQLGELYMESGDVVEAQSMFQDAADKFPDSALGFFKLGEISLNNGDIKVANNYFDKAIGIDSGNVKIWVAYARANLVSGGLSRANEYIDRALSLKPENDEVLLYAGIIKLKINDIYHAERYLDAFNIKGTSKLLPYGVFYYGLLQAQKSEWSKALDALNSVMEADEFKNNERNLIALKNNIALCSMRKGDLETAEKYLEEIVSDDKRILMNLAMVYWIQDKTEKAKELLGRLSTRDWMWMKELGEYMEQGQDWSKNKIEGLMEENPNGYNIVLFLGCVIPNRYPFIEAATRHVFDRLGIGIAEADGASCCPAPGVFRSFDVDTWMVLAARNITISEERGKDFVTMCNGCYGTLNDVNYELQHEKEKKEFVNEVLKEIGKEYKGSVKTRHIVDVLYNEIGLDKLKKLIVNKFDGLKVAVHYGCHILKPHFNKPWPTSSVEDPKFLDELVEITGAKSVPYKDKLMCCGAGGAVRSWTKDTSLDFTKEKLMNMREAGADIIIDCCPFCHLQMDLGQVEMNSIFKDEIGEPFNFPVIYITQLLGLAMGIDPFRLGLLKTPKQPGTPPFIKVEPIFMKKINDIDIK